VTESFGGAAVDVQIQPGQYASPLTVASGGVAFVPVNTGVTNVAATVPGFVTTASGSVDVTVSEAILLSAGVRSDAAITNPSSGGGAFNPYLLLLGMVHVMLINSRRRKAS
jgi:hypothetical protein